MRLVRTLPTAYFAVCILAAQVPTGPVLDPRGITNAFTLAPAPAQVGRGGILQIAGFNLGPPDGAAADGVPLPAQLADVQVFVNGMAAPLFSVSPGVILAQVPVDAAAGLAEVVVQRGSNKSRPARFQVGMMAPSVKSLNGRGYGQALTVANGQSISLAASGLGPTDPKLGSGAPGPAAPTSPVQAYIGGIKARTSATASAARVGEFEVQVDLPPGARPGDLVQLTAGTQIANQTVLQTLDKPEVQYVRLPDGASEIRAITDADLNGNYLIATGPRDATGCYPSYIFDFVKKTAAAAEGCLTAPNANAVTPLVRSTDGNTLAALVGPPAGEAPAGVSSRVRIYSAGRDPLNVTLPEPASTLIAGRGGDFNAILASAPPQNVVIDGETGEVRSGGGGIPGVIAGGGGGGGVGINIGALGNFTLNVDGLSHALSLPANLGQNRVALVVGDDPDAPKRAKFAVVTVPSGEVALSKDFPDGWMPLLAAAAPNLPAPGGAAPGQPATTFSIPREGSVFDAPGRTFYALARNSDNTRHGMAAFTMDRAPAAVVDFPDGWFAATCTPNIRISQIQLARKLALVGSGVADPDFKTSCPGNGFIVVDLAAQKAATVALDSQAQIDAAQTSLAELNDYLYGYNTVQSTQAPTDTVYVLDGVAGSTFTLTMPSGMRGFRNLRGVAELGSLLAEATDRQLGDGGLVIFDLDQQQLRPLPVPDGFTSMTEEGVFLATRKLVARGIKAQNAGSELMLFDLNTQDLAAAPNPEGVAAVGPPAQGAAVPGLPGGIGQGPGQGPGQGGGNLRPAAVPSRLLVSNTKANTVAAVAYDKAGKQVGVVVVRVP